MYRLKLPVDSRKRPPRGWRDIGADINGMIFLIQQMHVMDRFLRTATFLGLA